MDKIKNAKITSTMLGYEDHGIFTCMLSLDYGGSVQGFGNYGLDSWDDSQKKREDIRGVGTEFIRAILDTVGVETWEGLRGRYVRVKADYDKVYAIGHVLEDKWFNPKEFFAKYENV